MQITEKSEGSLVEVKARADSLDSFRKKLEAIEASRVGTFRQTDTYFRVPEGRLKLRETEGEEKAELIYYEREEVPRPKGSRVFILELEKPEFVGTFLRAVLEKKVVVEKKREVFRHGETQVHLDTVKKLGTFIELEQKTDGSPESEREAHKALEDLMRLLGIRPEDLVKGSYSDILHPS